METSHETSDFVYRDRSICVHRDDERANPGRRAGRDVQILFTPNTPGPEIAGLGPVETGKFVDGKWMPGRRVNGDDVVLEYDQAAAAAKNQSGSGLIFGGDGPTIQHVKLYRYR